MNTHQSQSGFALFSVTGLAVIVGLLLITGLGQWLWHNTLRMGEYCHRISAELSIQNYTMDGCNTIGTSIASFRNYLEQRVSYSRFGDTMNLEEFSAKIAREFASRGIGFNSPQLSGLIDTGMLNNKNFDLDGAPSLDKLRMALTRGSVGSDYLRMGNADAAQQWLKSSANMGEYGVLSQLSLGSAYMEGTGGIGKDLEQSYQYNSMALDSINKLQRAGTPESSRLLESLPAAPSEMSSSLSSALNQTRQQLP